jgi:hypothetical protein
VNAFFLEFHAKMKGNLVTRAHVMLGERQKLSSAASPSEEKRGKQGEQ